MFKESLQVLGEVFGVVLVYSSIVAVLMYPVLDAAHLIH